MVFYNSVISWKEIQIKGYWLRLQIFKIDWLDYSNNFQKVSEFKEYLKTSVSDK